MNRNYRAGYLAEQDIRKKFKPPRYTTMRSAGSHGPFDVIVFDHKEPEIHLIQAKKMKKWSELVVKKTIEMLEKVVVPISCVKELWVKIPRQKWITRHVE